MRLLVAGASGFLGRNVLLAAPKDWEIHATYNTAKEFPEWLAARGLGHVQAVRVDLRDGAAVARAIGGLPRPDACLYLAADTRVRALVEDPPADVQNNIAPVANVLRSYRGGRFVFLSSGAVYMGHEGPVSPGTPLRPTIPYAIGKLAAELYVQHAAAEGWCDGCVVLRFFGAYGPWEPPRKITTKLLEAVHSRAPEFTVFGDGGNLIDVMHVDDAVRGILAAVRSGARDVTLDFCRGTAATLNDFVTHVGGIFGHTFRIRHEGASPEYIRFRASPEEMADVLGFRPVISLEDGMRRFDAWLASAKAEA